MKRTFEIELNNSKIENYEDILSRFSNWKKYKREINLNLLLEEDKKIQFDVEILNDQSVFYVSVSDDFKYTTALVNTCSVINKFVFIILNNQIINLKVDVTFLDTNWGKKVKNILAQIKVVHIINLHQEKGRRPYQPAPGQGGSRKRMWLKSEQPTGRCVGPPHSGGFFYV